MKKPLATRVWYEYPGQAGGHEADVGWWRDASRPGRVLEDGTSQIWEATYNAQGVTERSNAASEERLKTGHPVGGVSIV